MKFTGFIYENGKVYVAVVDANGYKQAKQKIANVKTKDLKEIEVDRTVIAIEREDEVRAFKKKTKEKKELQESQPD